MKILSYRRFALWWQLAMDWFQRQFAAIAASIDLTPVEEKLDDVKSDVADVKTAVENIDFTPLAKDATVAKQGTNSNATNTAILAKFDDITIDTSNLATKNLEQFFNITGATSYTAASTVEILNELVSIWENVFDAHPAEVSIEGTHIVRYVDGHHMYEIPIPDENTLG